MLLARYARCAAKIGTYCVQNGYQTILVTCLCCDESAMLRAADGSCAMKLETSDTSFSTSLVSGDVGSLLVRTPLSLSSLGCSPWSPALVFWELDSTTLRLRYLERRGTSLVCWYLLVTAEKNYSLQYTTLLTYEHHLHDTNCLHCIIQHYITLHNISLHYITLHYPTLRYNTVHCITCLYKSLTIHDIIRYITYLQYVIIV